MSDQKNARTIHTSVVAAVADRAASVIAVNAYFAKIRRSIPEAELQPLVEWARECYAGKGKKAAVDEIRARVSLHGQSLGSVQANEVLARSLGFESVHQFAASRGGDGSQAPAPSVVLPGLDALRLRSITLWDWEKHQCVMSIDAGSVVREVSRGRGFAEDSPTDSADLDFIDGSVLRISGDGWRFIEGSLGVDEFVADVAWLSFEDLERLLVESPLFEGESAEDEWRAFVASKRGEGQVASRAPFAGNRKTPRKRR